MHKEPGDLLTGGIAIVAIAGLSAWAADMPALVRLALAVGIGMLVFFLLGLRREGATVLVILLLPCILLSHLLPKKLRRQLMTSRRKDDDASQS
ncbi:hypothetical protein GQ37_013425 [Janthinobacterium sp. BJB1]|uniref:hypothetical protein n=1 Tax=Janthinobacterium sp. GW458P TaxID=1981504 RepID=UPI000A32568E|nr:hypothetical protein [Janthinobacterium sp. GW458P]MBE3024491.1 hypothetical protein [Janthinobacterium sp. GW458P]PHV15253.1 hypothetical protein CSQ90_19765 [Janthinobacterium sp. BJB303]PJC98069.1 hypothetical protein GQ37_013425 [Janthinobacterium sp. BJB1]